MREGRGLPRPNKKSPAPARCRAKSAPEGSSAACAVQPWTARATALVALPCRSKLASKRIQVDEVCSFATAKQKNVQATKAAPERAGDTWTWIAIDTDSKLVIT